jgi:ABC-type nitrate/sulfonate/bicarbonate transport system substrate-binding protein
MRGKSTGVTRVGTVTDFFTRRYLRHNGLMPDRDVMIRQAGGLPEIVAAPKAGQIDGGTFGFSAVLHARAAGFRVLVDYRTLLLKRLTGRFAFRVPGFGLNSKL